LLQHIPPCITITLIERSTVTQTNSDPETDSGLPLVIVNPRSAGGSTSAVWRGIASDLRAHFGPFSVAFTKAPRDAIGIARRAAEAGRPMIIACGGDGTINEVANGILESGKPAEMGIMPSGTGGDLRRTLKIPTSHREASRELKRGRTLAIDVGRIRFQTFDDDLAERYFLNVSSFGLAASIIERVKGSSSLDWLPLGGIRGRASFALSTLQEVLDIGHSMVRISIDGGEEHSLNTVNFCVANARYFGGGMMIAPAAELTDGYFDVINIGDIGTAKVLLNAYTLYRGTHTRLTEVGAAKARSLAARPAISGDVVRLEVDGEIVGKLPAEYEIVPAALRVRIPANFQVR
jgi:diacylglycerol kinase (ATP)